MLQGSGAIVDCQGNGAAFKVGNAGQVVISGFDIRNAVGGTSTQGFAGGVDAINTLNISVLTSTFRNCTGQEAGAIAVHADTLLSNNVRNFRNLTILDCAGGNSNPREGGGAGSVSVSYFSTTFIHDISTTSIPSMSDIQIANNIHSMSDIQIRNSSGGTHTNNGGAAGSISLSYFSYNGNNANNINSMSDIQISNSSGGAHTNQGGAAGSISLSYWTQHGTATISTTPTPCLPVKSTTLQAGLIHDKEQRRVVFLFHTTAKQGLTTTHTFPQTPASCNATAVTGP